MNNFDKVKKLVLDTKIENDNSIAYLISDLSYYDYYEEQLKALEKIEDKLKQNITLHNVLCMLEDYKEDFKVMRLDKIKELLKEIKELSYQEYIALLILNEKIDYNSDIEDITDGDLDHIRKWIENTYMENDISLYSETFNDFINKEVE